ncbi:PKD domain-containing protein [Ferruginibacter sp.]
MKRYLLLLCLFGSSLPAICQVNLEKGLVAYYPFNGNANDESGNGNNAVFNNATLTSDRNGKPNSAYDFNGRSQYMRINNDPSLNFKGSFSISVWIKIRDFYAGKCHGNRIIQKGDTDYLDGSYYLTYDDNYYTKGNNCFTDVDKRHQTYYGPFSNKLAGTSFASPGSWNLLTYTYNGSVANLYVNCTLYASGPLAGYNFSNSYDLFFGRLKNPQYPYWFNGTMDDIRIYNRALSAAEVLALCDKKEPAIDFTYTITACNQLNCKISNIQDIKSYKWDFGDNGTATKESVTHTYKKEGDYNIQLIAVGTNGKEITVAKKISIVQPTAAFTYESTAEKNTYKFSITGKQKVKYKWLFGDGAISGQEKKITHTYKEPGVYEVLLVAEDKNGCRDTALQTITIAPPPVPVQDTIVTMQADSSNKVAATVLEKRDNNLLKEITVSSDSVSVTFYDNAEIDGDSVTIVYNNNIIVTHLFLTEKPAKFILPVNKNGEPNELVMYAENLGSIPPNTALMVVYDGDKRHEVSISSSKTSNGMVRFIFKR